MKGHWKLFLLSFGTLTQICRCVIATPALFVLVIDQAIRVNYLM